MAVDTELPGIDSDSITFKPVTALRSQRIQSNENSIPSTQSPLVLDPQGTCPSAAGTQVDEASSIDPFGVHNAPGSSAQMVGESIPPSPPTHPTKAGRANQACKSKRGRKRAASFREESSESSDSSEPEGGVDHSSDEDYKPPTDASNWDWWTVPYPIRNLRKALTRQLANWNVSSKPSRACKTSSRLPTRGPLRRNRPSSTPQRKRREKSSGKGKLARCARADTEEESEESVATDTPAAALSYRLFSHADERKGTLQNEVKAAAATVGTSQLWLQEEDLSGAADPPAAALSQKLFSNPPANTATAHSEGIPVTRPKPPGFHQSHPCQSLVVNYWSQSK